MFQALLPKGAPFFELLLQQNAILCSMTEATVSILENLASLEQPHREITRFEEDGDILQLAILRHLSQTFITPIDREDLLRISMDQEEAIDMLYNMSNRLYIFAFQRLRFPMLRTVRKLDEMARLTGVMLKGLSERRDSHSTRAFRSMRDECDMLLNMGLMEMYEVENPSPGDILDIMKWGQVYGRLEMIMRRIIMLAETIEEAVLKNV
ncbi:DUF47 family protein [Desulfosarcina sp. OttesenSCG-928-G10]|nr:DUF47 family protein [Desulfosarcina sp. OttesenSCG-928-G10]MDL2321074.1 DUF47 family protein [Desulfosarcina sp. OttesenSCG-928-B08]